MMSKLKNRVLDFLFKTQTTPTFPNFKKITFLDRVFLESKINDNFQYSTFNVTNLLAWDIHHTRMISTLNENLVFLLTDYETNEPFFVFYGTFKPVHTVRELLTFAKSHKISASLRFITEGTAELLKNSNLRIEEDENNFDYIFSTEKISRAQGLAYKSKRVLTQRFIKTYPQVVFKVEKFNNDEIKDKIHSVLKKWKSNKISSKKSAHIDHEEIAIQRLLESLNEHSLLLSSVTIDGDMVGFSVDEVVTEKFAMAHFIKADITYKGIYEFMNQRIAEYLFSQGVEYWNWQQDLGIPGLRSLKMSYRPVRILKKYRVSLE